MRQKLVLPALLLLLTVSAGAAELEDHMFSGGKFVEAKKYKEAQREFELAVGLAPDSAEANRLLGLTYAQTGDLDKAAQYSTKAAQLQPSYGVYYLLGLILVWRKHLCSLC